MTSRRSFLSGLIAATALPRLSWAEVGSPAYLAAAKRGEGYAICGIGAGGDLRFAVDLPARGHAATAHPARPEAVAFARRPGVFGVVLDCLTGGVLARLTPPEGRQFNGHGAFSADGTVLMTSEVIAEGSAGRVGLWDVTAGYRRIGEWDSGGIGPHDMKLLPDGGLVVANGGIRTDPDDRTKLNIGTMRPNLTYLDSGGGIVEQVELAPDLAQNSIRHLALGPGNEVAFAMQWEGDPAIPVPLLGIHRRGQPAVLSPEDMGGAMQGYAGSIAIDRTGGMVALTSPRGGAVMIHDAATGAVLATHRRSDLCGAARADDGGFTLTDGLGAVWAADADGLRLVSRAEGFAWDNHLIPVGV